MASNRVKIRLNSTAGTGHFITTTEAKNKKFDKFRDKNGNEKPIIKFDPKARKRVEFKRGKI